MPIMVKDEGAQKGRPPTTLARAERLFEKECSHSPRKKNCCAQCIANEMDDAIRRELISRGIVPEEDC